MTLYTILLWDLICMMLRWNDSCHFLVLIVLQINCCGCCWFRHILQQQQQQQQHVFESFDVSGSSHCCSDIGSIRMHVGRLSVASISWWVSILLCVFIVSYEHRVFIVSAILLVCSWVWLAYFPHVIHIFFHIMYFTHFYHITNYRMSVFQFLYVLQYHMSWGGRWQHVNVDNNEQSANWSIYVGMCYVYWSLFALISLHCIHCIWNCTTHTLTFT